MTSALLVVTYITTFLNNGLSVLTDLGLHPFRSDSEIVVTSNGALRGTGDSNSQAFLGIPYALPPRRFLMAESIKDFRWEGIRSARKIAPVCVQRPGLLSVAPIVGSEDCLYLDVYRPTGVSPSSLLPVMVYIPGGAFAIGSSYFLDGQFDGSKLAADENLIVVVINYRLNLFGFFATKPLRDANGGTVGNLGLQDQREALRWVKREIVHFGGNPEKILLFGESAGGFSVLWHAVSVRSVAENLFHSVIVQSATADLSWFFQPMDLAIQLYDAFAVHMGCPSSDPANQLACLQAIPYKRFLDEWMAWSWKIFEEKGEFQRGKFKNLGNHHPEALTLLHLLCAFGPVIDGHEEGLLDVPIELIKAGKFHKVPLVAGITKDEGTIFTLLLPHFATGTKSTRLTADQWTEIGELIVQKPELIPELYNHYPLSRVQGSYAAVVWANELVRDLCFGCSTEELVVEWNKHQMPAYMYLFSGTMGALGSLTGMGSMHSLDVSYVFKNFPLGLENILSSWDLGVSNEMASRWAHMARVGNPNPWPTDPFRFWPEYTEGNMILEFAPSMGATKLPIPSLESVRAWWMSLGHWSAVQMISATTSFLVDRFAKRWNLKNENQYLYSKLFSRETANNSMWPSESKCMFWTKQRPLPWITHHQFEESEEESVLANL